MEILRLALGTLHGRDGLEWPVHGFAVLHPDAGVVLVDTGMGGPKRLLSNWGVVNRSIADALAEHSLAPADVSMVVNTHLHFDHCGQNAVFRHAPFVLQRAELERARREDPWQRDWLEFAGARFELLDGDAEIAAGLHALATPGHTEGHQCLLLEAGGERDLFVGDAAYWASVFADPEGSPLPPGQAADLGAWRNSLERLRLLEATRLHFCHEPQP